MLLRALKDGFGIAAQLKGRNDIVYEDLKISGHAYKYSTKSALHHGTLLRDVDLETLSTVLNPSKHKLQSKGVASVQSRVTNLVQLFPSLTHDAFCDALERAFVEHHVKQAPEVQIERVTMSRDDWLAIPEVEKESRALADWNWRFGESPQFAVNITRKFPWALMDVFLDSQSHGIITRAKIFSDALFPDMVSALDTALNSGIQLSGQGLAKALQVALSEVQPLVNAGTLPTEVLANVEDFFGWLTEELLK